MDEKIRKKILEEVKKIPKGKTKSYSEIGKAVGVHARVVGSVLRKNFDPSIPCHRVIKKDGSIGGYNRGIEKKIELLKKEMKNK